MHKLPQVIIVGRTNVGKSTFFNRLSENVKSLALNYEGVTRDFVKDVICWQDRCFTLLDSGGISLRKSQDPLAEQVRLLGLNLLDQGDVLLFVVDGSAGLTVEDRELAKVLHKTGKPVIIAVNKIDNQQAQANTYDFFQLGFSDVLGISAQHGTGIAEVLDALLAVLPEKSQSKQEEPTLRVTFIGKPNVGKSSLMNIMLEQERVLVSEIPGTTREAITEPIKFYQETFTLTDTPGIRRKRKVEEPLEKLMVKTSFTAIDNADIVLLLVDGSEGQLSDQELKLAFYAFEQGKALILLINKTDLVDEEIREKFEEQFEFYRQLFKKIPHLFISCKSGKNVGKILPLIKQVWERYNQKISDHTLTMLFKDALHRTPLYHSGELLHVRSVKQISAAPLTLLVKVNHPTWFGPSQLAFFENVMRDQFDLLGVPVVFVLRKMVKR
ncbi:MAG: ribosome biogenesis GTPase Der [Candidatus Babeliales bacterium]